MDKQIFRILPDISEEVRELLIEHCNSTALLENDVDCCMTGKKRPDIQTALHDLAGVLAEKQRTHEPSFIRGVCSALSRLDPGSTEYLDIVTQAGGFDVLLEHAEEYDQEHLCEAMRRQEAG